MPPHIVVSSGDSSPWSWATMVSPRTIASSQPTKRSPASSRC